MWRSIFIILVSHQLHANQLLEFVNVEHLQRAKTHEEKGEWLKAQREYKIALDKNKSTPLAREGLVLSWIQLGEFEKAKEFLHEQIKENALDLQAYELLAKVYKQNQDVENELIIIRKIKALAPNKMEWTVSEALVLLKKERHGEAYELIKDYKDEEHPDLALLKIKTLWHLGQQTKSNELLKATIIERSFDTQVREWAAERSWDKKEWASMYLHAQHCLKIQPKHSHCLFLGGVAQAGVGQHDRAVYFFESAVKNQPLKARYRFELAKSYYQLKNYHLYDVEMAAIIKIRPEEHRYNKEWASTLLERFHVSKATEILTQYFELTKNSWAGFKLAELWTKAEDFQKAEKILQKMSPSEHKALVSAYLSFSKKDYDSAIRFLSEVETSMPNCYNFNLGLVEYARADYEKAHVVWSQHSIKSPYYAKASMAEYEALQKLGREDEAKKISLKKKIASRSPAEKMDFVLEDPHWEDK